MNCSDVRDRLTAGLDSGVAIEAHLGDCPPCSRFAARLESARLVFKAHHEDLGPDAAFAGRVIARLPDEPTEILGRTAFRLLPASLALVVVLAWFAFQTTSAPSSLLLESATDDLLTWVVDSTEGDS